VPVPPAPFPPEALLPPLPVMLSLWPEQLPAAE